MSAPAAQLHPAIDWIVERLAAVPGIRRVILFGSRAKGTGGERSDIDLAVESDAPNDIRGALAEIAELAPTLLWVDLNDITDLPGEWHEAIKRDGVVLYERAVSQA